MNKSLSNMWLSSLFFVPSWKSLLAMFIFNFVVFPFLTRKQYLFRLWGTLVDANIKVNRYTHHRKALVFLSSFSQLIFNFEQFLSEKYPFEFFYLDPPLGGTDRNRLWDWPLRGVIIQWSRKGNKPRGRRYPPSLAPVKHRSCPRSPTQY